MCGIFACFHNQQIVDLSNSLKKLQHRGPDNYTLTLLKNIFKRACWSQILFVYLSSIN